MKGRTMRPLLVITSVVSLAVAGRGLADEAKGTKVEYTVHTGYCELTEHARAEQLKAQKARYLGTTSFLAFTDQGSFDKAFGKTPDKEDLTKFLPNGEGRGGRSRPGTSALRRPVLRACQQLSEESLAVVQRHPPALAMHVGQVAHDDA
jgi:hypothetical protein